MSPLGLVLKAQGEAGARPGGVGGDIVPGDEQVGRERGRDGAARGGLADAGARHRDIERVHRVDAAVLQDPDIDPGGRGAEGRGDAVRSGGEGRCPPRNRSTAPRASRRRSPASGPPQAGTCCRANRGIAIVCATASPQPTSTTFRLAAACAAGYATVTAVCGDCGTAKAPRTKARVAVAAPTTVSIRSSCCSPPQPPAAIRVTVANAPTSARDRPLTVAFNFKYLV